MRNKSKCIITVLISIFLCLQPAYARELYEKGDAIYREKDGPFGHAGILCFWDQSDGNERINQKVIEATPPAVRWSNFDSFYHETSFLMVRQASLDYDQRNQIVKTASSQIGKAYNPDIGYKSPGVSFRCDGLVEYCYESVGADLVLSDTWLPDNPGGLTTLFPKFQMFSPRFNLIATGSVDQVTLISPSVKNACHPYYRGAINLKADVNDSNSGSGVAKVKFYNGTPLDDSNYISQDDHDETISGLYKTAWSTTQADDGKHNICFKSYDQAGNNRNDLIDIIVDNTPPLAATNLDSSTHKINKWYKKDKTSITTTWTAAKDDTAYVDNPADVSGIAGYGVVWNTAATSLPPEQKTIDAVTAMTNETPLSDGMSHYFHIRSVDNAGNWGKESASVGPFWIDATAPKITITVLREEKDGTKEYVTGRYFRVDVSDPIVHDARSGLDYVKLNGTQYGCNGSASWSKQI